MTVQYKWLGDNREQLKVSFADEVTPKVIKLDDAYIDAYVGDQERWCANGVDQHGNNCVVTWLFDHVEDAEGFVDADDLDWDNTSNIVDIR